MRFTLTAAAASVLIAACATSTEDATQVTETETEVAVEAETEAPVDTAIMADEDPYLWLEEVEGEEALAWVNAQNERSLAAIKGYSVFEDNFAKATDLATSTDRIPYGSVRDGLVYNF